MFKKLLFNSLLSINRILDKKQLTPFESNLTQKESLELLPLIKVTKDFDFSISLKIHSELWFYCTKFIILGYKKSKWFQNEIKIGLEKYLQKHLNLIINRNQTFIKKNTLAIV